MRLHASHSQPGQRVGLDTAARQVVAELDPDLPGVLEGIKPATVNVVDHETECVGVQGSQLSLTTAVDRSLTGLSVTLIPMCLQRRASRRSDLLP